MSDITDDITDDMDHHYWDSSDEEYLADRARCHYDDPDIWVTRDGQVISIQRMTDEHLLNAIQLFGRDNPRISALVAAATARGLFELGKPSCYSLSDFKIKEKGGQ